MSIWDQDINRGNPPEDFEKINKLIKSNHFFDFVRKLNWGLLNRLKMLPLSPLRFSTIGKTILRTFKILKIFRFFDNSSRTMARTTARATARAMAMATAKARAKARAMARGMARPTARARRTRARAKDRARDGRTDGQTAARSYLFSEMRSPENCQVVE